MSTVDAIIADSSITKLNQDIKKILDTLNAYNKISDQTEEEVEGLQNSINFEKAEMRKLEKEYKCMLDDCVCGKQTSKQAASNDALLLCGGAYEEKKTVIQKFEKQQEECRARKTKMDKLVANYEIQLEMKREELAEKLKTYLN